MTGREEDETIKNLREERRKNRIKKLITGIIIVIIIGILIGAYAFYLSIQDTYFQPEGNFKMPDVNWNTTNSTAFIKRTAYNNISGYDINITNGSEKSDGNFKVEILEYIDNYLYVPGGGALKIDELRTNPYIYAEKMGNNDYVVKELVLKYNFSDDKLETPTFVGNGFEAKNLYFLATKGNFNGYEDKLEYEWMDLHEMQGINKNAKDIKDCGFTLEFDVLMLDDVPFMNHTITLTVTLYYGHPTLLGWQDVHELRTSVVIYVVAGGG